MFKEILKLGFEDLGLQELLIRGFVDPMNGIVKDIATVPNPWVCTCRYDFCIKRIRRFYWLFSPRYCGRPYWMCHS